MMKSNIQVAVATKIMRRSLVLLHPNAKHRKFPIVAPKVAVTQKEILHAVTRQKINHSLIIMTKNIHLHAESVLIMTLPKILVVKKTDELRQYQVETFNF